MDETGHIGFHDTIKVSILILITTFLLNPLSCEKQADRTEQIVMSMPLKVPTWRISWPGSKVSIPDQTSLHPGI
jgi:hypothetical protein